MTSTSPRRQRRRSPPWPAVGCWPTAAQSTCSPPAGSSPARWVWRWAAPRSPRPGRCSAPRRSGPVSSIVLLIALGCVVLAISAVETGPNRSRELALEAALAAAAAGGRELVALIPHLQPVAVVLAAIGANRGPR